MADETPTPAAPAAVQDIGGASRVTPNVAGQDEGPSLEEQSRLQDEAAKAKATGGGEVEQPKPKEGEAEPPKPKEGEETPAPVDLKGTIFETLSPEMQTKVGPFATAFATNGTLTDAEVAEAAHATGMSEAVVRQFMAGATASAAQAATPIYEQAGGPDQFNEFRAWSTQEGNLTPREETTINKAVKAGDYETAAALMAPAMERWKAAGGGAPARDVTGEGAGGGGAAEKAGDVYGSWAQVQKDMAKPEYSNDPAFRKTVEQKLARSPLG